MSDTDEMSEADRAVREIVNKPPECLTDADRVVLLILERRKTALTDNGFAEAYEEMERKIWAPHSGPRSR